MVKVADEVWIATALLHQQHPGRDAFPVAEIVDRAAREQLTPYLRPGVQAHAQQHCVANKRPNPGTYRMLYAPPGGGRRLFRPGDDYHAYRAGGKLTPNQADLPECYWPLLEWYHHEWQPHWHEHQQPVLPEATSPQLTLAGAPLETDAPTLRIGLVGCVKSKGRIAAPAQELYTSPLFMKARAWAEAHCDRWYILSAKHGLVHPEAMIEPYEQTLLALPLAERLAWARRVHQQLQEELQLASPPNTEGGELRGGELPAAPGPTFVWLAGTVYKNELRRLLQAFPQEDPLRGLPIGRRLQWLTQSAAARSAGSTNRLADLDRFYALLEELRERLGGYRRLAECTGKDGWPERGLYFFFEAGEERSTASGPRVVRVGTHALTATSRTRLWGRLAQHRGTLTPPGGNHRGSIFRLHVGECLLRSRKTAAPDLSSWGKGNSAKGEVVAAERALEGEVSAYIGKLPFLWLAVENRPDGSHDRGYLERNAIALLSNYAAEPRLDPASPEWLGRHSSRLEIQRSGLWNVNHVGERYEPAFLDLLEEYVRRTGADRG